MPGNSNSTTAHICEISIYYPDRQEWITKSDGAGSTDIEPIKGGLSNAFKRAASIWNIGRYLYELPGLWVALKDGKYIRPFGKAKTHQTLQPVCQPIPESSASSGTEEGFRTDDFSLHFRPLRCHPASVGRFQGSAAQPDTYRIAQLNRTQGTHPNTLVVLQSPAGEKVTWFHQGPAFLTGRPEPSQPENCC